MSATGQTTPAAPPQRARWRERVLGPVRAQLTQGIAPERIALTLGVGTACALFPFLGFTTLLNLVVGVALRLNQPILQTLNQLLGPLQLALIAVYVRAGETLWGASAAARFEVDAMWRVFREVSVEEFLRQFGRAGLHAFTAWAVSAPLLVAVVYHATRPALCRAARAFRA
jgi:uncharacterized protein (DUF2062 family)